MVVSVENSHGVAPCSIVCSPTPPHSLDARRMKSLDHPVPAAPRLTQCIESFPPSTPPPPRCRAGFNRSAVREFVVGKESPM